ncbi:MAG: hypothetical protein JKY54_09325 [Flavobacteriales bacterium]|nr:hypothetical protein [Flavobacteriales bacterium]
MATTRVFKSGKYIILDDGVNEPDAIPTKDCRYSVISSQYTISDDENDLFSVVLKFADITNESGSAYASEGVFLTFLRDNTGGTSTTSTPLIYGIEVAAGNIPGSSTVQLVGRNPAVGNQFEDIWDAGVLSTLDYDAQTGNFTPGLLLTGGTSAATAIIVADKDDGATGTLTIRKINGIFQNDETITDSSTGSATSNGVVSSIMALIYPTAGETWEVICESANDTSAGTGARTVLVTYLDSSFVTQTETITLNGQTAVTFVATNAYRFVSVAVATWGSNIDNLYGKSNTGTIIVRDSTSENVRGVITFDDSVTGDEHGLNNSQDIHYTVPAGKTAFPVLVLTNVTKNHDVTARALFRLDGIDGFSTLAEMGNYQNSFILDLSGAPAPVPEKTDLKFIARSNNTSVSVVVELFIIEIDN